MAKPPNGTGPAQRGADLELPLPDDAAFLREKNEGEQRGEDHRGTPEDRVDAGTHVVERHGLGDLVDDVRERRNQTGEENLRVQARTALAKSQEHKRQDRQKPDEIAVKILRPGFVISNEIKLEERRGGPDHDGGEDREMAARK